MENLNRKLIALSNKIESGEKLKVAILGLGSVGNYLLDYLNSWEYENVELYIGARNSAKALSDINISCVAATIRKGRTKSIHMRTVDLDDVDSIAAFFREIEPDFVVNSSRVYSGLKYGSISWSNIRAYGLWAPLAIRYIKNIMTAHDAVDSNAIVINTSYSDAVIPWLKSAGLRYPDFGSGNLNHLIPRIKLAVAQELQLEDMENIQVTLATSHFHDVVISKEGHTEGVEPLLSITHKGKTLNFDAAKIWPKCAISMPVDAKRNMMNASSNFEIIKKVVVAATTHKPQVIHTPGVGGLIGGYPVVVDFNQTQIVKIDESHWSLTEMQEVNRRSIYLDGIENVCDGKLFYSDELRIKVLKAFGVEIPKMVDFSQIEETARFIIANIIEKAAK